MRQVHVITPGDHFSPSTGSAVPTVVDGLCRYRPEGVARPAVAVARGTYQDHYDSADIIEFEQAPTLRLRGPLSGRHLDGALSKVGLPRWAAQRSLAPTVGGQLSWEASHVVAHNAPQLVPLVDRTKHVPILYAHNQLLGTYGVGEVKRVLGGVGAIICVSQFLADDTKQFLPDYLQSRVRVVRNGVDLARFTRISTVGEEDRLRIAFVGRMIRDKGADVLVSAIGRLPRASVHLTLVGSAGFDPQAPLSPFEVELRKAAEPLGEQVTFLPFVPRTRVAQLLGSSDVVVVPSRWAEPFALTVLEGMAAGAAVVGSDTGGIPESVRGVGLLVPPNDVDALGGAIGLLSSDRELLKRTAAAGRAYAEAHDWVWASRRFHDLMRELEAERLLD